MTKENNGGPAFPQSGVCTPEFSSWDSDDFGGRGLSIRDYFAAKAMQAIVDVGHSPDLFANHAYEIADAMLRAREES